MENAIGRACAADLVSESSTDVLPELLAPAGDQRALTAAIQFGADAVYLGLSELSARRGARNFTLDELPAALDYVHLRGAKAYIALNVVILPHEMERALELAVSAHEAGADAFIVQDLGLARLLKANLADIGLHASTQLSAHSRDGVAALGALGFDRVTLARELPMAEVAAIAAGPTPVEVFVHGALCYCYSGQCLLSSMVGGRSGNRGLCVQACRLAYELTDDVQGPIDVGGAHPLSTRDLAAVDLMPGLVRAGVASLKIEGRLKSAEYVATVVDVYRRALDRYAADPAGYAVDARERSDLHEVFSRGFTQGYLAGVRDHRLMSPARPSDRGLAVGRVTSCDARAGSCDIKLSRDLGAGDEIEVWVRKGGRVSAKADQLAVAGQQVSLANAGQTVTVKVGRAVHPEDRVFRTRNARLVAAVRERMRPAGAVRTIPVDMAARLRVGEPLFLTATSDDGRRAQVEARIVQRAKRRTLDTAHVTEHLARLGGTAYSPRKVEIDLGDDCYMPFSQIHAARAALIGQLDEARLSGWRRPAAAVSYTDPKPAARRMMRPELSIVCDERATARALADAGVEWLCFDVALDRDWDSLGRDLADVSASLRRAGGRFGLKLPAILRDPEGEALDGLLDRLAEHVDALLVGNIGQAGRHGNGIPVLLGDLALNVTNAQAADVIAACGVQRVTLSPEVTGGQIAEIARATLTPLEVLVFGRLQVMVAEHCLFCVPRACAGCSGKSGSLRDEKNYIFPVRIDRACRTYVYNPFGLSLLRQVPELAREGIDAIRLDLGGYGGEQARAVVAGVRQILSALPDDVDTATNLADQLAERVSAATRTTTGHYFRAVQ